MINARKYETEMRELLVEHGFPAEALELVPSVREAVEGLETDPDGIALWPESGPVVLVREMIDPVDGLATLYSRYPREEVDPLASDDRLFMRHLMLHEIAHLVDDTFGEHECHRFAFRYL